MKKKYLLGVFVLIVLILFLLVIEFRSWGELGMKEKYNIEDYEVATFAGGCFWCMEWAFERHEGVIDVISGFSGGDEDDPSYEQVSSGQTGHIESVQVVYDSSKVTYEELLDTFWHQIDPTDDGGQFADRGYQYTTAIFYHDDMQKEFAEKTKMELENSKKFDKPIVTLIREFENFYPAEEYHQDYYKKNPVRYKFYRKGSGRDSFLEETWSEENNDDLKKRLTPIQYKVTQKDGTEPAFDNLYWDEKREGIYVDIVSGEPLFSSLDKYDSGTGWPSFTKPLESKNVVEKTDRKLFVKRVEVRSKGAYSHLGHVFDDGPKNSTGLRYCMNSAALRFVPKEDLSEEGYGVYLKLFD